MKNYCPLYCLQFEHDYFLDKKCRSIDVKVNPSSMELLRRRGLLFKQTHVNEWCILSDSMNEPYAGEDRLLLDLYLSDPEFAFYTDWKDFSSAITYELALPTFSSEFTTTINSETKTPGIKSGFCLANLKLEKDVFNGKTVVNMLKFHAKKAHWEYVLIPRGEQLQPDKGLIISEKENKIKFLSPVKKVFSNQEVWSVKSEVTIPISENYNYYLSLIDKSTGLPLIKNLPHPIPGCFPKSKAELAAEAQGTPVAEMIREVCYYELLNK